MRRQTTSTIGEAMSLWLDAMKLRQKVDESRIISSWDSTVGSFIASKTRNIYIKDRTLFVFVDSSVVRNELLLAKGKLLAGLNRAAGGDVIVDIVFR